MFQYYLVQAYIWTLNSAIAAGWMILAVLVLRLLLKRASKRFAGVLWLLVAVRLVLPVSLRAPFSLTPSAQTVPSGIARAAAPVIASGIGAVDRPVNAFLAANAAATPIDPITPAASILSVLAPIWAIGTVALLLYALVTYLIMRRRVRVSVQIERLVFSCDEVSTPFVLGFIHPKIYIPSTLDEQTLYYVKRHEYEHLARRDQWRKLIGYVLLSVFWMQPLCWLAFVLFCRDIEALCDERVIIGVEKEKKAAYSTAMLNCAALKKKSKGPCPLAFGEVAAKKRIKSILHYKTPITWVNVTAIVLCAATGACFLTLPKQDHTFYQYAEHALIDENGIYLPAGDSCWHNVAGCSLYVGSYRNTYDGDVAIYASDPTMRVLEPEKHGALSVQKTMLRSDLALPESNDPTMTAILADNRPTRENWGDRAPIEGVFLSDETKAELWDLYRRIENGEGDDTWHEWIKAKSLVYLWYPDYPELIRDFGKRTDLESHVRMYHNSEIIRSPFDDAVYFSTIDYAWTSIEVPEDSALYREVMAFWNRDM